MFHLFGLFPGQLLRTRALLATGQNDSAIVAFETLRAEQKQLGTQVARARGEEKAALLEVWSKALDEAKKAELAKG